MIADGDAAVVGLIVFLALLAFGLQLARRQAERAEQRARERSIVGMGRSVVHRLPSTEPDEKPMNFHGWWNGE